ncbi:DUF6376 family protein [Planomicrobium sp. CPCC 101110]|uniref:DUF6376 family protein n=1 Tax=Planomicrobium sp. CPCC 101110 TaxID=2599619 RepID=UPI0011B3FFD3|nr:DUF6376 family protein [Planomicrobium sp. CPCC 101110]TWT25183.1 hypothetical protein FQV30_12485 [Planomicrobium sp. CPCC 101110]
MKKTAIAFWVLIGAFLGGCSALEGASNTLTYATEVTEFANEATIFAKDTPALAKQAVSDKEAAAELEASLQVMKTNIEEFNELEPPEMAANLHQQVMNQNNKALDGIDLYLNNIKDGTLDPAVLENNEAFKSLGEIKNIVDQIRELVGQ